MENVFALGLQHQTDVETDTAGELASCRLLLLPVS